ncbi:MAG: hypothetical protein VKL42_19440 [Snowella sp.]|nr:hypothetical protein [Snowella sp.]
MEETFDIPGRVFDFNSDLNYGKKGEQLVSDFLDNLSNGDFEVKSDRYRNGRMVVETDQNPRGRIDANGNQVWVKSGINITTARWWVYIYSPEGAFIVVDVGRLKRYLRSNRHKFNDSTKINLGWSDNPAKGFLLMPEDVIDMLINPNYDSPNGK